MNPEIITTTGYGGTGSSAVTDLLTEFLSVRSLGSFEFRFIQEYFGLTDLEHFLIDSNHRSKVSYAIYKFRQNIARNRKTYEKFFEGQYERLSLEFIDKLIDCNFRKPVSDYELESLVFRVLLRAFTIIQHKFLDKGLVNESAPWVYKIDKHYSKPDRKRFESAVKEYISELLGALKIEDCQKFVLMDQLVPATSAAQFIKYADSMRIVIVDRDPRDLFLLNEKIWRGAPYICDTSDLQAYINWYKTMRLHDDYDNFPKNIRRVQFEDLVYDYQNTVDSICDFIGLSSSDHVHKRVFFDPEVSIDGTRLWERFPEYQEQVLAIEEQLADYVYRYS